MSERAIFTIEKVKTIRKGKSIKRHNNRKQDVYNADPSREFLNFYSYKTADFEVEFKKRIRETCATVAKNSVLAIEIVASAPKKIKKKMDVADRKTYDGQKEYSHE